MRAFPFDSRITGYDLGGLPQYDRASNSEDFARLLQAFLSDGVFGSGMCGVSAVENAMEAVVNVGCCLIQGRFGAVLSQETVFFEPSDGANPRIDTVVLRRDLSGDVRTIVTDVIKGTAAAVPIAPALTRDGTVWEIALADVRIPANSMVITQANITDTRLDTEKCGIVAAVNTEIDTSGLYAQIQADLAGFKAEEQAEFLEWFETIQDLMSGNDLAQIITAISAKAETAQYTATLSASGWSGSSAPFVQNVNVSGVLASDSPIVDMNTASLTASNYEERSAAWALVGRIAAGAGKITAYCYGEKPSVNIPIMIKVVR